jgi:iron complex outermembrane receptor protein
MRLIVVVVLLAFASSVRAQQQPAAPDPGGPPAPAPSPEPAPPEPAPLPVVESPVTVPPAAPVPEPAPAPVLAPDPLPEPVAVAPVALPAPEEPALETGPAFGAVAIVPQPGSGLAAGRMPRNALRIDRAALDEMHALGVHDALNARLASVVVNDVQNNPLQVDLQYRGFTASPLLGAPQGIAVYQNGVRIHDPLGDVVQWDLVPEHAIQEIELVPGANPLYGQNALGGGLVLRMKDGFKAPGHRIVASAGSFDRFRGSAEYGHVWNDWAAYASVSTFGEEGWRDESRSSAQHAFADIRQRDDKQEVGLSATLATTDLNGNGLAPIELLREDRSAVFTYPDNTQNDYMMLAADAKRLIFDDVWLSGTAYLRHLSRRTFNGDEGEFSECMPGFDTILCDEDGESILTETGGEILVPVELGLFDGVYNTTETASLNFGGSAQVSIERELADRPNQLIVGTSFDKASVGFLQRVELGHLTEARGVAGQGIFVGGEDFRTRLDTEGHYMGLYAVDSFTVLDPLTVQVAGRLAYSRLELIDREGTALNGEHDFLRVNPAAGVTYRPIDPLSVFLSYSEGSRAPSAIELACADPEEPCRLPNAFVADPPLNQVVTRAIELGVRGEHGRTRVGATARPRYSWSVAGFGSRNVDDIIFVAGSRIGTGYFRNAGQTQRVGVELAASTNLGPLEAYASYTLLRATFETPLSLPAAPNPGVAGEDEDEEAEGVEIPVERGDRMPGIPAHSFKAGVTVHPWRAWAIGVTLNAQSERPYRGDEANLIDGVNGYAIAGAFTSYQVLEQLKIFVKAENLFDAEYETFGLLAEPDEVLEGTSDPRFQGPGAPLGVWAGLELKGF